MVAFFASGALPYSMPLKAVGTNESAAAKSTGLLQALGALRMPAAASSAHIVPGECLDVRSTGSASSKQNLFVTEVQRIRCCRICVASDASYLHISSRIAQAQLRLLAFSPSLPDRQVGPTLSVQMVGVQPMTYTRLYVLHYLSSSFPQRKLS